MPPDSDAPQEMGPAGEVELSELDQDRLVDLKSASAALASEGKFADAAESFTQAIKVRPGSPAAAPPLPPRDGAVTSLLRSWCCFSD